MTTNNDAIFPEFRAKYGELADGAAWREFLAPQLAAANAERSRAATIAPFSPNDEMVLASLPSCQHRWVTDVVLIHWQDRPDTAQLLSLEQSLPLKYVFCATCGGNCR